jgi:hypothetical protein
MIERKGDRRRSVSSYFTQPCNEQRRPGYDRRARVAAVPMPGAVRVGFAEAPPPVERRRFADAGTE